MSKKNRRTRTQARQRQTQTQKGYADYGFFGDTVFTPSEDIDIQRGDYASVLAYKTDTSVNRATSLIADAVDAMKWRIMRDADGEDVEVASSDDRRPAHPFAQAIHDVFVNQGGPLLSLTATSILNYGAVYLAKTTNEYGMNRGIQWLNPWWTRPQIVGGAIQYFQYGAENGTHYTPISPAAVAYYHTYNPDDDLRGYSKIDAALNAINQNRYARAFTKFTFKNNARPGMVMSPVNSTAGGEGFLSPTMMEQINQQVIDSHKGTRNANRPLIISRPIDVKVFEQPELDKYYSLVSIVEREIFRTFGVPLAMAGDSSSSTFKDGEEVFKAFYKNTIIPLCRVIAKFFNAHLMPWLDPDGDCTFEFDTSEYEDTAVTDKAIADKIATQLLGGYLYLNEARVQQGLEARPEFEGFVLVNNVPTHVRDLGKPIAAPQISVTTPPTPQLPARAGIVRMKTPPSGDYCILAPLANNAAVQTVQDTLRGLIGEADWQTPDSFHLTLCYASGTIDQTDMVSLDGCVQALIADSVDQFATPDGYAIHLKVRPTSDLIAYQTQLVDQMTRQGMTVSAFSDVWQPHITLCYAIAPITPFVITPIVLPMREVAVSNEAYEVIGGASLKQAHVHKHKPKPYEFPKPLPVAEWREKAVKELGDWQWRAKRGKSKFTPVYTSGYISELVGSGTAEEFERAFTAVRHQPFEITKSLFNAFATQKGTLTADQIKAWTETRQAFSDEVLLAISDASAGRVTEAQFESNMKAFIAVLGEEAYRDGLSDAGVDSTQLDGDDMSTIEGLIAQQSDYVFFLADRIYSDGLSTTQEAIKPDLWVNKTLVPFYQAGLAAGGRNSVFEWVLGDTEHCATCLAMSGTQQTMKAWMADGVLPQSSELDCGGFNCQCKLKAIRLRPSR